MRRRDLASFALWSLVEAVPAVLSGRLIAWALDEGFLAGDSARGLAFLGLFALAALIGTWGTRQAYLRLAVVIEPFRDELVRRAVRGSLRSAVAGGATGDGAAVARLTQQVEIAREALASLLMVAQGFVVSAAAAIAGLLVLLPAAAPLVLGPLAAGLALLGLSLWRLARLQRAVLITDEELGAAAGSAFGALRDITAAGGEDVVTRTLDRRVDQQQRAATQLARMTALRTLAVAVGGWLPILLILIRTDWLLSHGATAGAIVGALTYVLRGVQPTLQQLANGLGGTGTWLAVTLGRIAEAASASPEVGREEARGGVAPRDATLAIDGMTFAYSPAAAAIVDGLSITVPDGEHLAIVGPSGAGKSTLANLVAGVLMPQSGTVRIGGCRICDLDPSALACSRVLIPQESFLLRTSVRENVTYLNPGVPAREISDAIARLGAEPLVARLGGIDAQVDPSALSGGERQLLVLVRAYLSPARLVILDEASSQLDPLMEAHAETAFAQRPGTLVVVAHRISSALRAHRILVIDGARATAGTHSELLVTSPLYRDLVGAWDSGIPAVA